MRRPASPLKPRWAWRHPEWWMLALSLVAWLALIARSPQSAPDDHLGHAWMPALFGWVVMVSAMMLPLVIGPVRTTACRSLWQRRHRAIVGFLIGYLTAWLMVGLTIWAILTTLGAEHWAVRFSPVMAAAVGFAIAAAWQLTPLKQRALLACHRSMPLAPRGWRADRDCVRYGLLNGRDCVISCWPLMVAPVLAAHHLAVMAGVSIVGATERYQSRHRQRAIAAAFAGLALACLALALVPPSVLSSTPSGQSQPFRLNHASMPMPTTPQTIQKP